MATIKDIAKIAGVAQGTVSNVLNGRGNVSSDKIRRVLDACEQLGYIPNEQAKQLDTASASISPPSWTDSSPRRLFSRRCSRTASTPWPSLRAAST